MLLKQDIEFYSPTILKSYNLDKTMRYQLNMLENLDLFTRRHSENVANLTDIGKIFIPPDILSKPSLLTDEEFDIMKTHTTIGYNMCMKDLKLRPYAGGALYHHECLDGSRIP